jgi:two-component system LytT family response regulator
MNRLTAFIVETDENSLLSTERTIKQYCPEVKIVGKFVSTVSALSEARTLAPNVVFLEIQLAEMNGIELAKKLFLLGIPFIFVTSELQFALAALKINAIDFIAKPIEPKDLIDAIKKVNLGARTKSQKFQVLIEGINDFFRHKNKSTCEYVALPTIADITLSNVEVILYCEGIGNYTKVIFKHGLETMLSKTLSIIERQLNPHLFFRVHNKYLVNVRYIKRMIRNGAGGILVMEDGSQLPLSKSRRKEFLSRLVIL